jgi:hypothetical protein
LIVATELGRAHDDLYQISLKDPVRLVNQLTSGQADEDRPSVSRDGKSLVYTNNRDSATAIVVRNLSTSDESTVRFEKMDYRRPTGNLHIKVVDAEDQKPIIARVSLKYDKGRFHAPPGALHRTLRNRGHFYCDGGAVLTIPAGTYQLTIYRGPEYQVASSEIVIKEGAARELTVQLRSGNRHGIPFRRGCVGILEMAGSTRNPGAFARSFPDCQASRAGPGTDQ